MYVALWIAKQCGYGVAIIVINASDSEELGVISSLTEKYYQQALKFAVTHGP